MQKIAFSMLLDSAVLYVAVLEEWTYPGFEGNQFKDHLHSEESSEEHVEDVHGIVEIFGLPMMLQRHINNFLMSAKKRSIMGIVKCMSVHSSVSLHVCVRDSPAWPDKWC